MHRNSYHPGTDEYRGDNMVPPPSPNLTTRGDAEAPERPQVVGLRFNGEGTQLIVSYVTHGVM